eukprot:scaffold236117_cov28-Tisochrysis_lutea.AAC.4
MRPLPLASAPILATTDGQRHNKSQYEQQAQCAREASTTMSDWVAVLGSRRESRSARHQA